MKKVPGGFIVRKALSLCLGALCALSGSSLTAEIPGSLWTEFRGDFIYNPIGITSDDYYPCVLFNEDCFEGNGDHIPYKMWHQGLNGIGYSISEDGINWLLKDTTVIEGEAYHPCVIYDKDGFDDGLYQYKIWFWNGVASTNIDAIQYAFSHDGVKWTIPQPITQTSGHPLVDGILGGYFYHLRGPGFVMFNKHPECLPGYPYTFPYVMLYDTASEGFTADSTYQQIALAYSMDGICWSRYTNGPILIPSGKTSHWDGTYMYRPSLVKVDQAFHMYYSGSNSNPTSGVPHADGIGHATSADGIYWVKDPLNPILSSTRNPWATGCFDSPHKPMFQNPDSTIPFSTSWRNTRTYAPSVLYKHFSSSEKPEKHFFKMWFTGGSGDILGQNEAIGYATSPSPCELVDPNNVPCPPRDFEGVVTPLLTAVINSSFSLKAKWKPSLSEGVIFYRIFRDGRLVRTVKAKKSLEFDAFLVSKSDWRKYSIAAVNDLGQESCRTPLKKK
jgi:hypothetical protein